MPSFLEERLPVDVRLGMSYADDYGVQITQVSGGTEYRRLIQPFPVRSFHVNFTTDQADLWARVLALYHRAYGKFAGFRVKCQDDFSSNGMTGIPTPLDQVIPRLSAGLYQLRKSYGTNGTALAGLGHPYRTIYKPVAGTLLIGRGGGPIDVGFAVSVDPTTGIVTISPPPSAGDTITAGFQFDLPCRFNSLIEVTALDPTFRDCGSIDLIELLNP